MPNCKKCKKEIPEGSLYCNHCGAPQQRNKKKKMYQRPDGLFEQIKTINGKRVAFRGKTTKEVTDKMLAYQQKEEQGPLFKEVAEDWRSSSEQLLAYNTWRGYTAPYRQFLEAFGEQPILEIDLDDVQSYFQMMKKQGYSQHTIKNYKSVLSTIFDHAKHIMRIPCGNPVNNVRLPSGLKKGKREPATLEELQQTILFVEAPLGLYHLLLMCTGCRPGEALALTGADIDRNANLVHIRHSVYWEGNTPYLKEPKTESGVRSVPLIPLLADYLPNIPKNQYLFTDGNGPFTKKRFETLRRQYRQVTGIQATPYQYRHAYATMLYSAGVDLKTAQIYLGHSDIRVTANIYTHISQQRQEEGAKNFFEYSLKTFSR